MSNLESMHQAVQFIEHHLKEPITVQDVADAAGYSLYHFSRTFNRVIGHSPYDYIMRRRLSESARELIESSQRIIDIALEYQFNNPETYSRAFRSMFGVPPNMARKNKSLSNLIFKSEITLEYIQHINQGDYLRPKFVERGAIHLVGVASLVEDRADARTKLQEELGHEVESIANRLRPERYYGVSFFPQTWEMEGFFYLAGVEVASLETIPLVLVGKTIPPLKYARFIHKGSAPNVGMTFDYIYQTWLPKSGNTLAAPLEIEFYGEQYRGSDSPDSESEILIPIC